MPVVHLKDMVIQGRSDQVMAEVGEGNLNWPAILDACGHCVVADGRIKTTEYELIRLVADQLDCPMPPLAA